MIQGALALYGKHMPRQRMLLGSSAAREGRDKHGPVSLTLHIPGVGSRSPPLVAASLAILLHSIREAGETREEQVQSFRLHDVYLEGDVVTGDIHAYAAATDLLSSGAVSIRKPFIESVPNLRLHIVTVCSSLTTHVI